MREDETDEDESITGLLPVCFSKHTFVSLVPSNSDSVSREECPHFHCYMLIHDADAARVWTVYFRQHQPRPFILRNLVVMMEMLSRSKTHQNVDGLEERDRAILW